MPAYVSPEYAIDYKEEPVYLTFPVDFSRQIGQCTNHVAPTYILRLRSDARAR